MTPTKVREFFTRLAALDPEPKTELEYATPYQLLVAVVLSAQATDKGVNRATKALFADYPTPQAMSTLGADGIARYINTIGLYPTKAKNVAALTQLLLERHDGEVPHDRAALEALPGVGRAAGAGPAPASTKGAGPATAAGPEGRQPRQGRQGRQQARPAKPQPLGM